MITMISIRTTIKTIKNYSLTTFKSTIKDNYQQFSFQRFN